MLIWSYVNFSCSQVSMTLREHNFSGTFLIPSSSAWKGTTWVQGCISWVWTPEFAIGSPRTSAGWPWVPQSLHCAVPMQAPIGIPEGISSQLNVRFWSLFSSSPLLASCYFLLVLNGMRKEPSRNLVYLDVNVGSTFWCSPLWPTGEGRSWIITGGWILISGFCWGCTPSY